METPDIYASCPKKVDNIGPSGIRYNAKELKMSPDEILDRTETCQKLGISRQTLLSWIRKGKLKVFKRVGTGTNSALLFHRDDIIPLCTKPPMAGSNGNGQAAEPTAA